MKLTLEKVLMTGGLILGGIGLGLMWKNFTHAEDSVQYYIGLGMNVIGDGVAYIGLSKYFRNTKNLKQVNYEGEWRD